MRQAFEAWAQRDGHIVRRREDKPEEYLVYETQRRWLIWQAALAHGGKAADAQQTQQVQKFAPGEDKVPTMLADEAAVRNRVLNEVLDAFSQLDENSGIEGIFQVIQSLKKKNQPASQTQSQSRQVETQA